MRYLEVMTSPPTPQTLPEAVAKAVVKALREEEGSLLVFLPGVREIARCESLLQERLPADVAIFPLHGRLDIEAQRTAVAPAPKGRRKVVLSTNVAETSLTIEGIRVVIDGGYERRVRYDIASGMERYETVPISAESATQRAGRAGRTAPGVCYRLWHEAKALSPMRPPEILRADLAPALLDAAAWGGRLRDLQLLDTPPEHAIQEAENLLISLNMIDKNGAITPHGEAVCALGLHPRLGHMLLKAKAMGLGYEGVLLANALEEGGVGRGDDLREDLDALHRRPDGAQKRRVAQLLKRLRIAAKRSLDTDAAGSLVALAYPERVALARGREGAYATAGGKGVRLSPDSALVGHEMLAVAIAGGEGAEARVFKAAPMTKEALERVMGERIEEEERLVWRQERFEAQAQRRLGALVLSRRPLPAPSPEALVKAWEERFAQEGGASLPMSDAAKGLLRRIECIRRLLPEALPNLDERGLWDERERWLLPYLEGVRDVQSLEALPWKKMVQSLLDYEALRTIERLAPEKWRLPSGREAAIDYTDPGAPVLAAKLQEFFGTAETPRIVEGRVPLTLHLLSPAGRPLAVTRDLRSFWLQAYPDVRKEMRGRYPKHPWPEDPMAAEATFRTKRRR